MPYLPDLIEEQIPNTDMAWQLLDSQLPQFRSLYEMWKSWYYKFVKNHAMAKVISDAMVVCYARMALRNGSLSLSPRSYHNETHIDDLLLRLIALSQHRTSDFIPEYGWSLLSLFMCSHDLRQSEINDDLELVGNNEQATYFEVKRLINQLDSKKAVRQEHKELLKLMIHGSTFGKGEDTHGNIYKGNLVKYILKSVAYFDEMDKELAYIACDIDTANVAAPLSDYAVSSLNVYHEVKSLTDKEISAKRFFGEQQEQYFFELQKFNSQIGKQAFHPLKLDNAPIIQSICTTINNLPDTTENHRVVEIYQQQIKANA